MKRTSLFLLQIFSALLVLHPFQLVLAQAAWKPPSAMSSPGGDVAVNRLPDGSVRWTHQDYVVEKRASGTVTIDTARGKWVYGANGVAFVQTDQGRWDRDARGVWTVANSEGTSVVQNAQVPLPPSAVFSNTNLPPLVAGNLQSASAPSGLSPRPLAGADQFNNPVLGAGQGNNPPLSTFPTPLTGANPVNNADSGSFPSPPAGQDAVHDPAEAPTALNGEQADGLAFNKNVGSEPTEEAFNLNGNKVAMDGTAHNRAGVLSPHTPLMLFAVVFYVVVSCFTTG